MGLEEGCVSYQKDPEQFEGCDDLGYWNRSDEDDEDETGECGTCKYGLKNIIHLIKKEEEK